ncbi:MAG: hypothetical protein WCD76_05875 [Pyrinomonadaceae bacterium]
MKKLALMFCGLALSVTCAASSVLAQGGGVAKGPDPSVVKDPEAEKDGKHNLEVARHYFKMKKAYFAAFKRMEELITGYPEFSQLDEALYIAGLSGLYLSEGKGKQAVPKNPPALSQDYSPDNLRDYSRGYLSRLVKEYPESKFRKEAEDALVQLGPAKTTAGAQ